MTPALELRHVSKAFRAIRIATELDLVVAENEAIGILGPNGAGKTTILGLITGTLRLDAGAVSPRPRRVAAADEERCRIGIARAYQVPQPFGDLTVFENLMVGAAYGTRMKLALAQERSAHPGDLGWGPTPTRRPVGSRSSTANGWSSLARSTLTRACCCSTRSPAASRSMNARNSSGSSSACTRVA